LRLDKWLWSARFFRTRTVAAEAIAAGHVSVNDERAKAAKALRVGDVVVVRKPPFEHAVVVKGFAEQRGSATVASTLFEETPESRARRAVLAAEMKSLGAHTPRFKGRPTKKTRRDYEKWLRSPDEE
jgi:ribosome-associated heat shock protein Hsp15